MNPAQLSSQINRAMIVDINPCIVDANGFRRVEVSYKIVDFRAPSRISSFMYNKPYFNGVMNGECRMTAVYSNYWFWKFFSTCPVVITIGAANKQFIKQFVSNVYDLYEDDIKTIPFARQIHARRFPLTPYTVMKWENPSTCPSSKCRYRHDGRCAFKNVQCMIEWLNDPIF